MIDDKYDIYYNATVNRELKDVTIEVLTKCNWKCIHCYIPEHNNIGIDNHTLYNLLLQCRQLGVIQITLTGGEIFLRKDIINIIEKARKMYFQVVLFTNVSLLDEATIKRLSELYIKKISCTIFSMNPEIHDSITGVRGSWKATMNNIKLLKKYNLPIEVKTVLMKNNSLEYRDLVKYCKNNSISYQATPIVSIRNNRDESPIYCRVSEKEMQTYVREYENKGVKRSYIKTDYTCKAVRYSLDIDSEGYIYPCNVYHGTKPLGNIYKNSLKEIWDKSTELHEIQDLKYESLTLCSDCKYKLYCNRCPAMALLEDNNLYGKSTLVCNHARARYKMYEKEVNTYAIYQAQNQRNKKA